MYVPAHFSADDDSVHELLSRNQAADLVTAGPDGLEATMLPFVYDRERATLQGHFARNNDHWRHADGREALVIVRGPDSYVTPSWYASKAEHGRVVPTWNYVVAHVHGTVTIHDDTAWLDDLVRRLTDHHEGRRAAPVVGRRRAGEVHRGTAARDRRRRGGDLPRRGQVQAQPEPARGRRRRCGRGPAIRGRRARRRRRPGASARPKLGNTNVLDRHTQET